MALADDVALRIPAAALLRLTNPEGGLTPTSQDSTKLAQACSSIEAYFARDAEETYDGTVAIHLEVAVRGVVGLLKEWGAGNHVGSKDFWDGFREECVRVKNTRSRARITPTTNSQLTPSEENPSGEEKRPWADDDLFRGLVPARPSNDDDDE